MTSTAEINRTITPRIHDFAKLAAQLEYSLAQCDWLDALHLFGKLGQLVPDLAADAAQAAYNAGSTKKAIAELLGVSPRDLQGMVRES